MTIPSNLSLSSSFFFPFSSFSIHLFIWRRMSIHFLYMKNIWCSPLIKSFSSDEQFATAFNGELIMEKWRSYGDRYKKKTFVKCKSRTQTLFVFLSLSCINAINGFGLWTIWIKRGATNIGNFILSFFFVYSFEAETNIWDMLFSEQDNEVNATDLNRH